MTKCLKVAWNCTIRCLRYPPHGSLKLMVQFQKVGGGELPTALSGGAEGAVGTDNAAAVFGAVHAATIEERRGA